MLHRRLQLVAIDLIDEVDFLQLLRAWFQRFLISNNVSVVRRCIRNIDVEVDCNSWLAGLEATLQVGNRICLQVVEFSTLLLSNTENIAVSSQKGNSVP